MDFVLTLRFNPNATLPTLTVFSVVRFRFQGGVYSWDYGFHEGSITGHDGVHEGSIVKQVGGCFFPNPMSSQFDFQPPEAKCTEHFWDFNWGTSMVCDLTATLRSAGWIQL